MHILSILSTRLPGTGCKWGHWCTMASNTCFSSLLTFRIQMHQQQYFFSASSTLKTGGWGVKDCPSRPKTTIFDLKMAILFSAVQRLVSNIPCDQCSTPVHPKLLSSKAGPSTGTSPSPKHRRAQHSRPHGSRVTTRDRAGHPLEAHTRSDLCARNAKGPGIHAHGHSGRRHCN